MKLTYEDFLRETENVNVQKQLREFTLTHKQDDTFELKSSDFQKVFSVEPYKNEVLEKLKNAFNRLIDSIEQEDVNTLYDRVTSAERLDYKYGNVFPIKFSLISVSEIDMHLTDEQKTALTTSEKEFLLNSYSQLPKSVRTDIIKELTERAQVLCCVIEALFYYIRNEDKNNYYNGLATDEIIEEYEKAIKESSKKIRFSYEGPSSDDEKMVPLDAESKKAFWLCEKDMKKFVIFGTISTKELYSEENIGGTKGLKLSIDSKNAESGQKDWSYFNTNELSNRIESFYKKVLKK